MVNIIVLAFVYLVGIGILLTFNELNYRRLGMNIKKGNGKIKIFGSKLNKTWLGSGAFFVTSFVISIIALYFHREIFDLKTFWLALAVAVTSTLAELISWRGSDNLTIPLSVVLILVLFL